MRKKLLIDEHPIQVLPTFARIFGLNEAIIVQQLHYWLNHPSDKIGKTINGIRWIHNTYEEWMDQFPFWSRKTIIRTITTLKNIPLICMTNEFNKQFNLSLKRNWFTLLYSGIELIENYLSIYHPTGNLLEFDRDKLSLYMGTSWDYEWGQPVPIHSIYITETSTETYTETTKQIVFEKLIDVGFKKKDAKQILNIYPEDFITEKISYLFFEINTNHKTIEKKSSWLFKALHENYSAPKNYERDGDIRKTIERNLFSAGPSSTIKCGSK
jgi:hypothetical protein